MDDDFAKIEIELKDEKISMRVDAYVDIIWRVRLIAALVGVLGKTKADRLALLMTCHNCELGGVFDNDNVTTIDTGALKKMKMESEATE